MLKERVIMAYELSKTAHAGQKRKYTNLDYFTHPKAVARIIEKLGGTEDQIIAGLLHDGPEDTSLTIEYIENMFGGKVASLVNEVTNKPEERANFKNNKLYMHWKFRQLSQEGLFLKFADRFHNVLYLERDASHSEEGISFIKYYRDQTKYITENLLNDIGFMPSIRQTTLYTQICLVIDFLELMY